MIGMAMIGTAYQNGSSPTLRMTISNTGNRELSLVNWTNIVVEYA